VVALYERGFGFGDVLLPRDLVAAHAATTLDDYVLVNGSGDLSSLMSRFAGLHTASAGDYGRTLTEQARHDGLMGLIAVVAIAGFILVGVVTTLGVATASRRRELTLLRLVGATRQQLMRALRLETAIILGTGTLVGAAVAGVTLFAFASGVTGLPMLSVPPLAGAGMVAAVAVPGAAAVLVPARRMLRRGSPRIEEGG
jgi:putative ABC transport system permease protein